MTTRAARALMSEMHPCDDRDNAHSTPGGTWHMSSNRMASMLDAVERQAVEVAAPPSDPAAPLRKAAQAVVDEWRHPDGPYDREMKDRIHALADALETAPSDPAAPLDVERLARAMAAIWDIYGWDLPQLAGAIAREYAALTPAPKEADHA